MKKILFSLLLSAISMAGFSTTWTITNNLDTFVPAIVTIAAGDSVNFVLAVTHQPREVSKATWDANGNTALPGGFQTAFGGGLVLPSQLTAGTHYYVCSVHYLFGMKGTIIVQSNSGVAVNQQKPVFNVFPNPAANSVTLTADNDLIGLSYYFTDQAGRQIIQGKLNESSEQVDISFLPSGVYLIQLEGIKNSSVKLIKK